MTRFPHDAFALSAATMILLLAAPRVPARTIEIDATSCDRIAVISAAAPRHGWAAPAGHRCCWIGVEPRRSHGWHPRNRWSAMVANDVVRIDDQRRMLISFSLDERIPENHRVVHAQLTVPVTYAGAEEPRFYLWRVLPAWGPGVCHRFRTTQPEPVGWTEPGAAGLSSDRATRPTDIVRMPPAAMHRLDRGRWGTWNPTQLEEMKINVTEDVDLWHRGAAPNHGWLFTVEDPGDFVEFLSPVWDGENRWRLRITHEPAPEPDEP